MIGEPKPSMAAATKRSLTPVTSNSNLSDSQAQTPNSLPSVIISFLLFLLTLLFQKLYFFLDQ